MEPQQYYRPKVTVITSVYNGEKYLEDCIKSVLNQSYDNFEYIIIDGGSTDKTIEIIKYYEQSISYWVSEADSGIYDAWNKGVEKAKGDWITFLGSDDKLLPDALEIYVKHIGDHTNRDKLQFVSSLIELVDDQMNHIKTVGHPWIWKQFKRKMTTWHVGTFHARHLFTAYGIFDSSFKISGDYELLLRVKNKLNTSFINKQTAKMRTGGISDTNLLEANRETYKAKIKNGVLSYTLGNLLQLVDLLRLTFRKAFR
jgi:glycosyltransferase involved in cell wall biosynthesis